MALDEQQRTEVARAFRVESHGTDFIPDSERWAKPSDLFGMWAGASFQIEYFVYGVVLMTFGVSFAQAAVITILGNLSYVLLGIASLQGPETGTTVFAINRASYGPQGSRMLSLFNWLTQVGFETEGLILVVFAGEVLAIKAGFLPGTALKVVFIAIAAVLQFVLPFLGHATIVKTLRVLIAPFIVLYAILAALTLGKVNVHLVHSGAGWETFMGGLAFVIVLSGLGWTECGNDYSRYLPAELLEEGDRRLGLPRHGVAGDPRDAARLRGRDLRDRAQPELERRSLRRLHLGAQHGLRFRLRGAVPDPRDLPALLHQQPRPLLLGRHAAGARAADQALAGGVRRHRDLQRPHDLRDLRLLVLDAVEGLRRPARDLDRPVVAIFLVDWVLRRYRYSPENLQRTDRDVDLLEIRRDPLAGDRRPADRDAGRRSSAWRRRSRLPKWLHIVNYHFGGNPTPAYGADFSVFAGMLAGGFVYLVLAGAKVRREGDAEGASTQGVRQLAELAAGRFRGAGRPYSLFGSELPSPSQSSIHVPSGLATKEWDRAERVHEMLVLAEGGAPDVGLAQAPLRSRPVSPRRGGEARALP